MADTLIELAREMDDLIPKLFDHDLSIIDACLRLRRIQERIDSHASELSACRERVRIAVESLPICVHGSARVSSVCWICKLRDKLAALASCAPPHSDGIGGVCLGCEDCNPGAPNSRRRPLAFESKEEAQEYSKQAGIKVWAKIWSWTGVFEIYPGGRSVWNKNW